MVKITSVVLTIFFAFPSFAQEEKQTIERDTTFSNYKATGMLGGATSTQRQLEINNSEYKPQYRVKSNFIDSWFDWKHQLNSRYGIQFGVNYAMVAIAASDGVEELSTTHALGGAAEAEFVWNFLNRSTKNSGSINVLFDLRHAYGESIDPAVLHETTGSAMPVAGEFFTSNFRLMEFFWQQALFNDRFEFVLGKIDPFNYFTNHPLMNGMAHFLNAGFSVSPVAAWPSSGLGVGAGVRLLKARNVYLKYGLHDVFGDELQDGEYFDVGEHFFEGQLMQNFEVVWMRSPEDEITKRISVTYWQVDEVEETLANNEEEIISSYHYGWAMNASWLFAEKIQTFFSFGWANGGGLNSLAETSVATGAAYRFENRDVLGLGINYIDPIGNPRNQTTMEMYYRFQPSPIIAISPSVQWVVNPSNNSRVNSVLYVAVRGRITL